MIDYNTNPIKKKQNKPKRCVSPFKKKRIITGKKQKRKDLSTSYTKNKNFNNRNLSNQKIKKDVLFHDPMVYSSVMYKYHNNTAKKVNLKISQIRKNIMSDVKRHNEKKKQEMSSLSKSVKKKATKKRAVLSREKHFSKKSISISQIKKRQEDIMTKFETFRKKSETESSNRIKGSIYETIKKASKKIKNINTLNSEKNGDKKNRRNYSLSNKMNIQKSSFSQNTKNRRNISSNNKRLNVLRNYKKRNFKPHLDFKKNYFNSKKFVINTAKSFFKHKPRDIKIKVQNEYNLETKKTRKNPKKSQNYIKPIYNNQKSQSKQTFYSLTKSNETLKIEAIANSLNVNLDSLTETMRNKSDLEFRGSINQSSNVNKQLLEELKLSQMQNLKFTEIINNLQLQIEQLKKSQMSNFSFKNLSNRDSGFNPTVESGRNSK
jgi:hypothetical protein